MVGRLSALLVLVVLAGCEGKPSLVGGWSFPHPRMQLTVTFGRDGTFTGAGVGGSPTYRGTYSVESDVLLLEPSEIRGLPVGSDVLTSPTRFKMEPLGPGAYRLSAPSELSFVMSRLGKR